MTHMSSEGQARETIEMADDPLAKAVADALAASLKGDEPNWPTQRNWDAADAKAIRIHTAAVVAAVRQAPGVALATLAQEDEPVNDHLESRRRSRRVT